MEIAEVRDLDGPNMFMLRPAIKLEIDLISDQPEVAERIAEAFILDRDPNHKANRSLTSVTPQRVMTLLSELIHVIHDKVGVPRPEVVSRLMEAENHVAVAFGWSHRAIGNGVARLAYAILSGEVGSIDASLSRIREYSAKEPDVENQPEMLTDQKRHIPVIGITGTNGKTTTTRLISSILMRAGKTVGWTSSTGVYIQTDMVIEGDYTGPSGAARVFEEPGVDIAVLETARGGILLRGLGYESNDVSVVTNVSPDHLGLHGVFSLEMLAEVKRVVASVTRPDGFAVLNAHEPMVLGMREHTKARPFLVARDSDVSEVLDHVAHGGWALVVENGEIVWLHDGMRDVLTAVSDVPIAFGGRATHMLENALCAAAACLAIGLPIDQVRSGLNAFRNRSSQNRGRLNVYVVDGKTIIVDFAHNEQGLKHLLAFGRTYVEPGGRLIAVVGTAGDRADDVFIALGKLAASEANLVIAKDTTKYLRGRNAGEVLPLIVRGIEQSGATPFETCESETTAFERAQELANPGDVVALMCIEDYDTIIPRLDQIGTSLS